MSAQFAQLVNENGVLLAYGPLGVICGWFMWRNEKLIVEIRGLSHRIDGMTRAMLAEVLSRDTTSEMAKTVAKDMLDKIEGRNTR